MNILLCGAYGFIGQQLGAALEQAGHVVVRGVHQSKLQGSRTLLMDYRRDTEVEVWMKRLQEMAPIDVVINAVGLFRETADARFTSIHRDTPVALFKAAERCGVKAVVQISALGGAVSTAYLQSKREADAFLQQTRSTYLIVRPSLVVGLEGASSRFFRCMASLPILALPGRGQQLLQPVHIDDLCEVIVTWVSHPQRRSQVLNAVGPTVMTYREMVAAYRTAMHLPEAIYLPIPMRWMRQLARVSACFPRSLLTPDGLTLLEGGSAASAKEMAVFLGRSPKGPAQWFLGVPPRMLAAAATADWSLPLLRYSLALVWLITGVLSLGIYPQASSLELLAPLGLTGVLALVVLYGAAGLDLLMGAFTLFWPSRRLWLMQMVLILAYSLLIALALPAFYLHPFGPVLKNLPILALLIGLYSQQSFEGESA